MTYRIKLSEKEMLKELLHVLRVKGDIDTTSESAINEFGTLRGTLAQSSEDLKKIKAFTPTVIRRLKTLYSLFREIIKPQDYDSDTKTFEGLSYFMHTAPKFDGECLRILFLDEKHTILKDFIYKKGSGNQVKFYFREIVREVLHAGISSLVIIHHKLDVYNKPSPIDWEKFQEFQAGFKALDINLIDYLIISSKSLFSFKYNKLYPSHAQI